MLYKYYNSLSYSANIDGLFSLYFYFFYRMKIVFNKYYSKMYYVIIFYKILF